MLLHEKKREKGEENRNRNRKCRLLLHQTDFEFQASIGRLSMLKKSVLSFKFLLATFCFCFLVFLCRLWLNGEKVLFLFSHTFRVCTLCSAIPLTRLFTSLIRSIFNYRTMSKEEDDEVFALSSEQGKKKVSFSISEESPPSSPRGSSGPQFGKEGSSTDPPDNGSLKQK